jgi:hypothetical protein
MSSQNPYLPPTADLASPPVPNASNDGSLEAMMMHLSGTKPWVRLLAVLGFIGAGFMVIAAIGIFLGGSLLPSAKQGPFGARAVAIFYLLLSAPYAIGASYLYQYGSAIGRAAAGGGAAGVAEALDSQRRFWKFAGVMTLALLAVMVLAVIGVIVAAVGAVMR